ncbi:MAG: DUF1311 domain-containing protein [Bacteroidetes bacterium]|nr:DUF1311 domain-containing protein [Bacteroidota bacterium]
MAQQKEDSIDIRLQKCIDADGSTMGMINCTDGAYDEWDKELNKYYKLLMGVLGPEAKARLKAAQVNWLTYRDSEFAFINSAYNMDGTMWGVIKASGRMELVKKRALELKEHYGTMTMH